ncbi:LLM class F420-dependent oxidoreductase [Micromonospora sonneratiae]|uniref:TIGR03619 family F420-dependent LLM class oxidoreductase n=1 Tax=Micromonospora sonneratiae TaxID=1184706 RepID=A0ABW3YB43_9ACTN
MATPRIGVSLPHFGPYVGPDAVVTVAQAAERFGFHAVSVSERLLMPVRSDWSNDAKLPESYAWDPLELLTWAAAHTQRIRLSTGIVNAIFQPPIVLARRLATLDQLSRGRLDVGLGQGGGGTPETAYLIPEEFTAVGVPVDRRGPGFVEHVAAMRACWAPDPVEFHGRYYRIPRSTVGPKPYAGTIPLYFGALVRRTIERAAQLADGVVLVAIDWDETRTKIDWYRDAGGTGRVVVNTMPSYPEGVLTETTFTDMVLADLDRAGAAGVDEMHISLNLGTPVPPDRQAELLEALATKLSLDRMEISRP